MTETAEQPRSTSTAMFNWYELMTTDTAAAAAFYSTVVGWSAVDAGVPGMPYTRLSAGSAPVAGLAELPAEARAAGVGPSWIGYIAVDDVDAYAARVWQEGGSVQRPPADIPGIGRFSIVADPQGTPFVLFAPIGTAPERPAFGTPGTIGWHELFANDWEAAFTFYSRLFGWEKTDTVDMGSFGVYQTFSAGAAMIGGMMTRPEGAPGPLWLYYFTVDGIDDAVARLEANGGQLLMGPQEVPGGAWVVQCRDPQGAMFALSSNRR